MYVAPHGSGAMIAKHVRSRRATSPPCRRVVEARRTPRRLPVPDGIRSLIKLKVVCVETLKHERRRNDIDSGCRLGAAARAGSWSPMISTSVASVITDPEREGGRARGARQSASTSEPAVLVAAPAARVLTTADFAMLADAVVGGIQAAVDPLKRQIAGLEQLDQGTGRKPARRFPIKAHGK